LKKSHFNAKLQLTGQFWDVNANRLYLAFPMGWSHPFWSQIMARVLITTILQIKPCRWVVCRISTYKEKTFTKYLERKFKRIETPTRYFTIHAKAGSGVTSYVFVHRLPGNALVKYQPEAISQPEILKIRLAQLLDYRKHPAIKRLRRFSTSRIISHELRLTRMRTLVNMAVNGIDHDLYEFPNLADPYTRLVGYLKADLPLIANLNNDQKLSLLKETGLLTGSDINITEMRLKESAGWKLVLVFRGMPANGITMDKSDGRFFVSVLSEFAAVSRLKNTPDTKNLAWELICYPNVGEDKQ
jgi:hypothetical protein